MQNNTISTSEGSLYDALAGNKAAWKLQFSRQMLAVADRGQLNSKHSTLAKLASILV